MRPRSKQPKPAESKSAEPKPAEPVHTKDKLASALREVGLDGMADLAWTGYYHDFLSPLELPEMTLVNQLNIEATKPANVKHRMAIAELRNRVINGEFDASAAESEAWAASPEGQAAMEKLHQR
jgi:hypothetical protein